MKTKKKHQNLWDMEKEVLRGKFIAVYTYIIKHNKVHCYKVCQQSNLPFNELKKENTKM